MNAANATAQSFACKTTFSRISMALCHQNTSVVDKQHFAPFASFAVDIESILGLRTCSMPSILVLCISSALPSAPFQILDKCNTISITGHLIYSIKLSLLYQF